MEFWSNGEFGARETAGWRGPRIIAVGGYLDELHTVSRMEHSLASSISDSYITIWFDEVARRIEGIEICGIGQRGHQDKSFNCYSS